jgi:hypothetical protein
MRGGRYYRLVGIRAETRVPGTIVDGGNHIETRTRIYRLAAMEKLRPASGKGEDRTYEDGRIRR